MPGRWCTAPILRHRKRSGIAGSGPWIRSWIAFHPVAPQGVARCRAPAGNGRKTVIWQVRNPAGRGACCASCRIPPLQVVAVPVLHKSVPETGRRVLLDGTAQAAPREQDPETPWFRGRDGCEDVAETAHQKMRRLRAEQGLCIACGKPNDSRTKRCTSCREKHNAPLRAKRAERRASGLCISCGRPTETKATRCRSCRAEQSALQRAKSAERVASGLCIMCGGPNDTELQRCSKCGEKFNASQRAMRAELEESRICISCGGPNDTTTQRCSSCRARLNASVRKMREERVASGTCISCGSMPARPGKLMCASCARAAATWARKARSRTA